MSESVTIQLPYGDTHLEFALPKKNLLAVLEHKKCVP